MPEFSPGDVFVNHRIEGLAGRGGMGVVYRTIDLDLDRVVALKVITPALADDPDFRARFVAESKAAASIEHPHVIPVYYAGEREGVLFIVMRYVDGPDLRALVRAEGTLDPERAAHIVADVGGALDAAHAHGLVHRDVKPANVLLGADDHAYLTDFGLTKREASTGAGLSRSGGWVGTLGFVAPEQIRGERVDARTDVYALGCVLVHALTGAAPYMRDSDEATLWAHLNAPVPTDRVPAEFRGVVERALAKDPAERFPSAGDLGRAALAAAGRSISGGPERNVARGAAAPEGTPQTAATARVSLRNEGETHLSPRAEGETAVAAGAGAIGALVRRRPRVLAGVAVVLVAGIVAAIALSGSGSGGGSGTAGSTSPSTTAPAHRLAVADKPLPVASRPNSLTIANGRVWVLSAQSGEIVVLDAKTSEQRDRIGIGEGGSAVTGGFDSIWAVKSNTQSLIRISASTGRRKLDDSVVIANPGQPIGVASGEGAVWVAVRKRGRRDGTGETVVRFDPSSLSQNAIAIPGGVQSLAVGAGAVWVTTLTGNSVVRIDANNLSNLKQIPVGKGPKGIAVGGGAVWVADSAGDALTRINPRTYERKTIALDYSPTLVTVGGGSVWVTAREANRLIRIDPNTRTTRETIKTGSRPFALDVSAGNAVWITLLNASAVQRVRFYP
jgi:YVTN family beta-propeller protein